MSDEYRGAGAYDSTSIVLAAAAGHHPACRCAVCRGDRALDLARLKMEEALREIDIEVLEINIAALLDAVRRARGEP